jgi:hypothetical protein
MYACLTTKQKKEGEKGFYSKLLPGQQANNSKPIASTTFIPSIADCGRIMNNDKAARRSVEKKPRILASSHEGSVMECLLC